MILGRGGRGHSVHNVSLTLHVTPAQAGAHGTGPRNSTSIRGVVGARLRGGDVESVLSAPRHPSADGQNWMIRAPRGAQNFRTSTLRSAGNSSSEIKRMLWSDSEAGMPAQLVRTTRWLQPSSAQ